MLIWTNEIPTYLHLFWATRDTTGKTNQYKRKTKFQWKLVKWPKKNAYSPSHLRKINEKIRQKLGRHTSHWCSYPRNHHSIIMQNLSYICICFGTNMTVLSRKCYQRIFSSAGSVQREQDFFFRLVTQLRPWWKILNSSARSYFRTSVFYFMDISSQTPSVRFTLRQWILANLWQVRAEAEQFPHATDVFAASLSSVVATSSRSLPVLIVCRHAAHDQTKQTSLALPRALYGRRSDTQGRLTW